MFEILFSTRANKEFTNLDKNYRKRITEVLLVLPLDPVPTNNYDVKKLSGLRNTFRIRVGKLRLVYTIDWENKSIVVMKIESRERVYN